MNDVEKVRTVFAGIAAGDAELATRHVSPDRYVEHDLRVADGVAGLRAFVAGLPAGGRPLDLVRVFQDGAFVLTQARGDALGRNVFFDVFRFDDGMIAEHWGFSTEAGPPNRSGHTQEDGPTEARHGEDTAKNKALVRDYYETIHVRGDHGKISLYFHGDHCIRHEPGVEDGVAAFQRDLERLVKDRSIDEIKLVLGQGDFVFIAANGTHKGGPCVYVDLYRVEGGKLVERWGFPEEVPPSGAWKNNNGML